MFLRPQNEGVKDADDEQCQRESFIPLITDGVVKSHQMFNHDIDRTDHHNM